MQVTWLTPKSRTLHTKRKGKVLNVKYLNIVPGVSAYTDAGRVFSYSVLDTDADLITKVNERDEGICKYCGFQASKHQTAHYTGQDPEKQGEAKKPENYVTACHYCQQCFYLDQVAMMQSGTIIWLPEIGQAALNHICRAIYIARITQGPIADAARETLDVLLSRKEEAKNRIGTDDVAQLATVLQDFLENKEYKTRHSKLKHLRVLPLDRRIVHEGDLEFNQFPQILSYWRSKDGPFGEIPPRVWAEKFLEAKGKIKA